MEIGRRDRGGGRESDNPSTERATAILGREPLELGQGGNGDGDPEDASDDRSGDKSGFACCVAKDGTDDGADTCQGPRSEERRYSLQGNRLAPGSRVFALTNTKAMKREA